MDELAEESRSVFKEDSC